LLPSFTTNAHSSLDTPLSCNDTHTTELVQV
jgi:hypothetical protein